MNILISRIYIFNLKEERCQNPTFLLSLGQRETKYFFVLTAKNLSHFFQLCKLPESSYLSYKIKFVYSNLNQYLTPMYSNLPWYYTLLYSNLLWYPTPRYYNLPWYPILLFNNIHWYPTPQYSNIYWYSTPCTPTYPDIVHNCLFCS